MAKPVTAYLTIELVAGTEIIDAAVKALDIACLLGVTVKFNFNGFICYMDKRSSPEWLEKNYRKACDRKLQSDSMAPLVFGWIDPNGEKFGG